MALPHSKVGPKLSGPALAVGGPLADLGETISRPPSSHPISEGISERTYGTCGMRQLSQIPIPFSSMLCGSLLLVNSIKS